MGAGPRDVPHGGAGTGRGEADSAFQPVHAGHDGPLVAVGGGQQDAGADEFELEPGRGRPAHLGEPFVDQVGGAAQLGRAEHARLGLHPLDDVVGGVDQPLLGGVGNGGEDDQVTQPFQQVGDEPARVVAALDDPVDHLEGRRPVPGGERLHHGVEQRTVRVAEQRSGHGVRHALVPGTGEELVHHGHGVTHGTGARPHDQRQYPVLDGDVLLLAHLAQVVPQRAGRHEPERVVVGTGADGPDDLLGLGGGEDELQMLRRLLDDLEQRVEAGRRDHVGLVDDVDLVPAARGPEEGFLPQVTGVVHTTVRGGVDLDHVERARPVAREVAAGLALAARRRRRALLAVQAAGQDPGTGGLPAAARTAEQVRVIDPVVPQRLLQRVGDVFLPDDLGERLRAVTAVQRERGHAYEVIGAHRQRTPSPGRPRTRRRPRCGPAGGRGRRTRGPGKSGGRETRGSGSPEGPEVPKARRS
ncbi:hypothetical protein B0E37_03515 [Streptomyces sp. MH192]|nr:hypothetical protein [Streptomyces sp. MH192]MCF0103628.1 hypothetical protein [Streptomyces sp. MH191]